MIGFRFRLFWFLFLITIVPFTMGIMIVVRLTTEEFISAAVNRLDTIAQLQEARVKDALNEMLVNTQAITSEALITAYESYLLDPEANEAVLMRTMNSIKSTHGGTKTISLLDNAGTIIVSTDPDEVGNAAHAEWGAARSSMRLVEVFKDEDNILRLRFMGPVRSEGSVIGYSEIITTDESFVRITDAYEGFGSTGETHLVTRNRAGDVIFLNPLRFDPGAALRRALPKESTNVVSVIAVSGEHHILTERGYVDYRGQPVIAVTRYVPALDWGIVVKMDRLEILSPIFAFQRRVWIVVLGFYLLTFMACLATPLMTKFRAHRGTRTRT
jgi:hypothetical protein